MLKGAWAGTWIVRTLSLRTPSRHAGAWRSPGMTGWVRLSDVRRMAYFVYLMASGRNGTLYVGVTNNVARRAGEHLDGQVPGFTRRYGVKHLVWYETHDDVNAAIAREKQIKGWNRAWKVRLIESINPNWDDLTAGL